MISTSFTITLFDISNSDDITDRVLGFSTTITAPYGATGRAEATITLDNNDGAFTPNAGGTYGSVDYFAKAILIDVRTDENGTPPTNYTSPVFHGLITGFELDDNGVNSTVTLTCDDHLTVGSRSRLTTSILVNSSDVGIVTAGWSGSFVATSLPLLDGADFIISAQKMNLDTVTPGDYTISPDETVQLGQLLDSSIMPSGPFVYWPEEIRELFGDVSYEAYALNPQMNRQDTGTMTYDMLPRTFTFTESPSSAGDMPIAGLRRGWTIDLLKNTAQVTKTDPSPTPVVQQVDSDASINKHGQSAFVLSSSVHAENDGALEAASRWANKFDTPRFVPRQLTITTRQMESSPAGSAELVQYTMSVRSLWQLFEITYTPTGAASARTDYCVPVSRSIQASPSNTIIEYELLPAVDALSFVLNSSTLGVLNENRLG